MTEDYNQDLYGDFQPSYDMIGGLDNEPVTDLELDDERINYDV